jgi:hypothetical protein
MWVPHIARHPPKQFSAFSRNLGAVFVFSKTDEGAKGI